jgi:uncharacterized protein YcnI
MRRQIIVGAVLASGLLAGAGTAAAHVIATPGTVTQGSATEIAFHVPDEEESASTTKLQVAFPADHPIASVTARAMPGWHITIDKVRLARPMTSDDGPVTEAVSTITWSGGTIAPDTFADFTVSLEPVPSDTNRLVFKAVQTYDNGDVVRWIDTSTPGGAEPEHPAPTVTLRAAAHGAASTSVTAAPAAAGPGFGVLAGIVLGLAALALAAVSLRRTRGSR